MQKRPFLGVQSSSPMRRIAFHPSRPSCLRAELADRDARVIEIYQAGHTVAEIMKITRYVTTAIGSISWKRRRAAAFDTRGRGRHAGAPSGGCSSTRGLYSTSWMRPSKVRCSIISRATSG